MTVPSFTKDLDGILTIAGTTDVGSGSSALSAPDGSGAIIGVDPTGVVTYADPSKNDPYHQYIVSADGKVASIMPLRGGGPLPGARWWHFALIIVPTTGL